MRAWAREHNAILTAAAACLCPILYLLFIDKYATNAFFGDDWTFIPVVHAALHGQLSLGELWGQYTESRYFISNAINVLFGYADGLDLRSLIFLSAALHIASYAGLLLLVRQYLDKRLTPVLVLVVGAIWFSLADAQDSLWASHLWGFLTVFFYIMMLVVLLVPKGRHRLWFVIGVVLAVVASLASIQGFLCWPLGMVCILWDAPSARRALIDGSVWLVAAIGTATIYFSGYTFTQTACVPSSACSLRFALHDPLGALRYFVVLVDNVIPDMGNNGTPVRSVVLFEIVGVALLAVAVVIVVQSWRYRKSRERRPLPLLLIAFALLTDAQIALGRSGLGTTSALSDRYILTNLVLLTGIVIYAWARVPPLHRPATNGRRVIWIALAGLAVFLTFQVAVGTRSGLMNGRAMSKYIQDDARLLDNLRQVPKADLKCEAYVAIWTQPAGGGGPSFGLNYSEALEDQLGEFRPSSAAYYRTLGRPPLFRKCRIGR
jgi:hypothetical protein